MALKTKNYVFDQINLGKVSNLEELDFKVLAFQNKKLCERLEYYKNLDVNYKHKLEQYEQKVQLNESVICLLNRYWNILDENLKIFIDKLALEASINVNKVIDEANVQKIKEIEENTDINIIKFKINLKRKCLESSSDDHSEDDKHKKFTDSDDSEDFNKYGKLAKIRKMQDLSKRKAIESQGSKEDLFDLKEPDYNLFIEELFTDDKNSLDLKLGERVEFTKNFIANIIKYIETFYVIRDDTISYVDTLKNSSIQPMKDDRIQSILHIMDQINKENESLRINNMSFQNKYFKEQLTKKELKDKLKLSRNLNEELQGKVDELEFDMSTHLTKEIKLNAELVNLSESCHQLQLELTECKKCLSEVQQSNVPAVLNTNTTTTTMSTMLSPTSASLSSINNNSNLNLSIAFSSALTSSSLNVQIPLASTDLDLSLLKEAPTSTTPGNVSVPIQEAYKLLEFELQQEKEISSNRLTELEKMHSQYIDALNRIEKLQQFKDKFTRVTSSSGVVNLSNNTLVPPINNSTNNNGMNIVESVTLPPVFEDASNPPTLFNTPPLIVTSTGNSCCDNFIPSDSCTSAFSFSEFDEDFNNFNEHKYVVNSDEYKTLHCQFAILQNDNKQLKYQCEELRKLLHSVKIVYLKQIDDVGKIQRENTEKYVEDAKNLQDSWFKTKKELDLLRIEHEQFISTREQYSVLSQETKITIANLQEHNRQLKREIMRWKKKLSYTTAGIYHRTSADSLTSPSQPNSDKTFYGSVTNLSASNNMTSPTKRSSETSNKFTTSTTEYRPEHATQPLLAKELKQLLLPGEIAKAGGGDMDIDIKTEALPSINVNSDARGGDRKSSLTNTNSLYVPPISTNNSTVVDSKLVDTDKIVPVSLAPSTYNQSQQKPSIKMPSSSVASNKDSTLLNITTTLSNPGIESSKNEVKDLKDELKKSLAAQKELKTLLDIYKNISKEQRDKVELLATEKRLLADLSETKERIKVLENTLNQLQQTVDSLRSQTLVVKEEGESDFNKLSLNLSNPLESTPPSLTLSAQQVDLPKKLAICEERIASLQKRLFDTKQEEEALLKELEVTGQAFEDMQEQNIRLLQQLREKDDANFKLMTERIKANQLTKLIKDEKELQASREDTLKIANIKLAELVDAYKEKEKLLQNALQANEKEARLRMMSCDLYRTKTAETLNALALLKDKFENTSSKLGESQLKVEEKMGALEKEHFRCNRLKEELGRLKDKLKYLKQRQQSSETAGATDDQVSAANAAEIMLLTEEIRSYKELMTCPSCKSNRKDAMLTKCYHVFCYRCLKTRYDTRRRKCPECAAPFGANDFHRLFLY